MKLLLLLSACALLIVVSIVRAEDSALLQSTVSVANNSNKAPRDVAAEKALLTQIVDALAAKPLETDEVARKDPQHCLDKLEFLVSRPGAENEREAFCMLLCERLRGPLHVAAKVWILKSLERIGKAESVPAEIALLGDADELVRETARRALAANPSDEATAMLRTTIGTTTEPVTRAALLEALGFKRLSTDIPLFQKEASSADAGIKAAAMGALNARSFFARFEMIDHAEFIVNNLNSSNKMVWQRAIDVIAHDPNPVIGKPAIAKLKDVPDTVKPALIAALGHRGEKAALPALFELSTSTDPFVRVAATQAIGDLGDASAVAPLMKLALASKGEEQRFARDSLERLKGKDVDDALIAFLSNEKPDAVKEAAQRLAARNATQAAPAVLKLLTSTDASVRAEAIKTLGTIGGKDALEALLAVVAKGSDADRDAASKAIVALSRRLPENDGHMDELVKASKEGAEPARIALLTALGQLGGAKALDAVHAASTEADEWQIGNRQRGERGDHRQHVAKIQDAAFRALTNWPDATPLNDMLESAKTSTNETHRVLALRAFARMAAIPGSRAPKDMLTLFASAQDAVKTPDDRKLMLNAMSDVKDFGAVDACAQFIADPKVSEEACIATIKAAKRYEAGHAERLAAVMKDILAHSKNAATKKDAQGILDRLAKN